MAKNDLTIALVVGAICIVLITNVIHDKRTIAVITLAFLGGIVYLSKRKPKLNFSKDKDLCLSISDLLYHQTPNKQRDSHFIFYRQENTCSSAYWNGRFINKNTVFQLSDEALHTLTELVDALHAYYRQNNLSNWNILRFSLAADKRKYSVKVEFDHNLENNTISFQDYLNRYAGRTTH